MALSSLNISHLLEDFLISVADTGGKTTFKITVWPVGSASGLGYHQASIAKIQALLRHYGLVTAIPLAVPGTTARCRLPESVSGGFGSNEPDRLRQRAVLSGGFPLSASDSLATLQSHFLAILPRIEAHGRVCFRNERCASRRAELLAEMIALSWKWYVRLANRGKDPSGFISAIATFAVKAVKSGRRVCGQEKAKDVLSSFTQKRQGFTVGKLPSFSTMMGNELTEALIANTLTPPDEQAAFRNDFPAWVRTQSLFHNRCFSSEPRPLQYFQP